MAAKKKAKAKSTASTGKKRVPLPKKKPARKAGAGKPAAKKVAKQAGKAPATKGTAGKPVAKKSVKKQKVTAKMATVKKAAATKAPKSAPPKAVAKRPVPPKEAPPAARKKVVKRLGKKDLEFFRKLLLNVRDQVVDEISFLAGNNLNREHVASSIEDGTDNFERELALKLVGAEQDIVYEIDEALVRINNGTYGICEISGELIERERLKVLPHARYCVKEQSEIEKGRTRYRPFGPSLSRSISD